MKRKPLWKVSVVTDPEAGDAITELLQNCFGLPASSYTDTEKRLTTVVVFSGNRPESFHRLRSQLQQDLKRLSGFGLNVAPARISLRNLRSEDWANSWKRHFKPIQIGAALLIKPSWSRRRPRPGQAVIILNPGLSFGTGQHPTTRFCLREIAARRDSARRQSFLDIGTGSGILAIGAAKLGYSPVDALDCDQDAVRIAGANARRNRVIGKVKFRRADLTKRPAIGRRKYDVICANLISTLLIGGREQIVSRLARGGILVAAGILKSEFAAVRKICECAGLKLIRHKTEQDWQSAAFSFRR